jgi:hypothetical protein
LFVIVAVVVVVVVVRHSLTHSPGSFLIPGPQQDASGGTAAVVGVSCYLESGRRKREKEQDYHRFFGDPAFHQVCFSLSSSLTMDALFSFFLLPGSHKC